MKSQVNIDLVSNKQLIIILNTGWLVMKIS